MTELEQQWAWINRHVSENDHAGDLWLAMRLYTLPIVSRDQEQDRPKVTAREYLFEEYEQWLIEIKPMIRGEDWFTYEQLRGLFEQAWGQEEGIQSVLFRSPQGDGAAADQLLMAFESCLSELIRDKQTATDEIPTHNEVLTFIKDWRQAVMLNASGIIDPQYHQP